MSQGSARIFSEPLLPINGDHHQICKFECQKSDGYITVVQNVKDMLGELEARIQTIAASVATMEKAVSSMSMQTTK